MTRYLKFDFKCGEKNLEYFDQHLGAEHSKRWSAFSGL